MLANQIDVANVLILFKYVLVLIVQEYLFSHSLFRICMCFQIGFVLTVMTQDDQFVCFKFNWRSDLPNSFITF